MSEVIFYGKRKAAELSLLQEDTIGYEGVSVQQGRHRPTTPLPGLQTALDSGPGAKGKQTAQP